MAACLDGYSFSGKNDPAAKTLRIACLSDGSLSPHTSCQPVECGVAPFDKVQHVSQAPPPSRRFVFGEKAEFTCQEGYTLDGTSGGEKTIEISCTASGIWTEPEHCQPVHCGAPPPIANGSVDTNEAAYPSAATYRCHEGYSFELGDPLAQVLSRSCLSSGEFAAVPVGYANEGGMLECKEVFCGEPPTYPHAKHEPGIRHFLDIVSYTCEPGYSTDGTLRGITSWSVHCAQTGHFSPSDAESCQVIGFNVEGIISDSTNMRPLRNAQVTVTQGSFSKLLTTNRMGVYSADGVPTGEVTIKATMTGFIENEKTLSLEDHVMSGGMADLVLSPVLPADGYRISVTWGERPYDLDSHLAFGPTLSCRMDWMNTNVRCGGAHVVLDVDDTWSYGPETSSIFEVDNACRGKRPGKCLFKYYVQDYSGTGLRDSGANVEVFHGDQKAAAFKVADAFANTGTGGVIWTPSMPMIGWGEKWYVFALDGVTGDVKPCTTRRCNEF